MTVVRNCSHARSWYTNDGPTLSGQLDDWLSRVDTESMPKSGARAIIAPHAGYAYSGPAAAWAYKALDLSNAKRIFLLGPSHYLRLPGCALSECTHYATPLGDLALDTETICKLKASGKFPDYDDRGRKLFSKSADETEHSLEMHLPYIYKMLSNTFPSPDSYPPLVPILVGHTTSSREREYSALLAPYLADPTSIFIISSDFCHWGDNFNYFYYLPENANEPGAGYSLSPGKKTPTKPPIHESIERMDKMTMDAIETGVYQNFQNIIAETGNTVCGRHPIGVFMAMVERLREEGKLEESKGLMKFTRYERSKEHVGISDSSVSYVSGFAVL